MTNELVETLVDAATLMNVGLSKIDQTVNGAIK